MGMNVNALNTQISELRGKRENSFGILTQRKNDANKTQADIQTNSSNQASASGDVTSAQTTLDESQAALSSFTVMTAPDRASYEVVDPETGEKSFDESGYNAAMQEFEANQAEYQELQNQVQTNENDLAQKQEVHAGFVTEGQELSATYEVQTRDIDETSEEISQIDAEIDNLTAQLEEAKAQEEVQQEQAEKLEENKEDIIETVLTKIPAQNNKGWGYYVDEQLKALDMDPKLVDAETKKEIENEIKDRYIKDGYKFDENGGPRIGTEITLENIDESQYDSAEVAKSKYDKGQEVIKKNNEAAWNRFLVEEQAKANDQLNIDQGLNMSNLSLQMEEASAAVQQTIDQRGHIDMAADVLSDVFANTGNTATQMEEYVTTTKNEVKAKMKELEALKGDPTKIDEYNAKAKEITDSIDKLNSKLVEYQGSMPTDAIVNDLRGAADLADDLAIAAAITGIAAGPETLGTATVTLETVAGAAGLTSLTCRGLANLIEADKKYAEGKLETGDVIGYVVETGTDIILSKVPGIDAKGANQAARAIIQKMGVRKGIKYLEKVAAGAIQYGYNELEGSVKESTINNAKELTN